jgi:hypothetical protein
VTVAAAIGDRFTKVVVNRRPELTSVVLDLLSEVKNLNRSATQVSP